MMSISRFAQKCKTTVKTIRFYHDCGLLTATYVSPISGYRYYSSSDLDKFFRITALKDAGLSLQKIKQHIHQLDDECTSQLLEKQSLALEEKAHKCKILSNDFRMLKENCIMDDMYSITLNQQTNEITFTDGDDSFSITVPPKHLMKCFEILNKLTEPGMVTMDYDDLKYLMKDHPFSDCFSLFEHSPSENSISLLPPSLHKAEGLLAFVTVPISAPLDAILNFFERLAFPSDTQNFMWGVFLDEEMGDGEIYADFLAFA